MGNCDTRQMLYAGCGADPTIITEAWLSTQICSQLDIEEQYCWVAGDYVYFVIYLTPTDPNVGSPPLITRKVLINDLSAILRDNSDAQLYWDILETP